MCYKSLALHQTDAVFAAEDWRVFEGYWPTIDPFFGRLICWITFSAGAELLIKGVCLANDVEIRQPPNADGISFLGLLGRCGQRKKAGRRLISSACLREQAPAPTSKRPSLIPTNI